MSIATFLNLVTGNTARRHASNGLNGHEISEKQREEAAWLKAWATTAASLHRN